MGPAMTAASPPPWLKSAAFAEPVLVTGVPRSGTSMVAGILGTCGLWLGATVPGGKANPKGFFENARLREQVQKQILARHEFDPLGVRRLPPADWQPQINNLRSAVAQIIAGEGYDGDRSWGFKDAKMTLTWRIWQAHFPAARWVIVRRPKDDIVRSCLRTGFMRQHSTDAAYWARFVDDYLERLDVLQRTVAWSGAIDSGAIVTGRCADLEALMRRLGLTWQPAAVRAFVSPDHWHAAPA